MRNTEPSHSLHVRSWLDSAVMREMGGRSPVLSDQMNPEIGIYGS